MMTRVKFATDWLTLRLSAPRDAESPAESITPFVQVLLWTLAVSAASTKAGPIFVALFLLCACAAMLDSPPAQKVAASIALALQISRLVLDFPWTANHSYLQAILLALAVALDWTKATHGPMLLSAWRWLCIVVIFYSGLQKLLYGDYFDGRMLAMLISKHPRYQFIFGPLIGDAEVSRLSSYNIHDHGDGPFLVDNTFFVAISNVVWAGELGLALFLLIRPSLGALAGVALFLAIEVAAREIVFGLVMLNLLALFAGRTAARVSRRFVLLCTWAFLAVGLRILPGFSTFFGADSW